MPGFAAWLRDVRTTPDALPEEEIREALAAVNEEWAPSDADGDPLERPLLKAAAHYLLRAKTAKGLPIDPVARFHLRNGALVERINFAADLSKRGMDQAAGLMVNYLYDLDQIERNHEAFTATGEMAASGQVLKLLSP
jgi:malonyl-CoA decarboxylase